MISYILALEDILNKQDQAIEILTSKIAHQLRVINTYKGVSNE